MPGARGVVATDDGAIKKTRGGSRLPRHYMFVSVRKMAASPVVGIRHEEALDAEAIDGWMRSWDV